MPNLDKVINNYLVNFSKFHGEIYYLYENNNWIKIKEIKQVPYHLTIFTDENGNEYITCKDSYRIITEEDYINKNIPSEEYLNLEKSWRSKLQEKDELDFLYKDKWIKVMIVWKNSDIIPDICNICQYQSFGCQGNWIGYYYCESKKFAQASTYTIPFTEEKINQESVIRNEIKMI